MGYRWLRIPTYGALALGFTLAGSLPVFAQAVPRTPSGVYDRYDDYAYENGYTAGAREGERDARDNKDFGFKRDEAYEDADAGFRGGDKDRYRFEFRRGYEAGYDTAYRRYARNDWYRDRPSVVAVPVPVYPNSTPTSYGRVDVSSRIAYENGYRDGAEEGQKDFDRHRAFEPTRRDRYRDGDRGYEDRYGARDAYKADYRAGFRAGYEEAYRNR
jgi:hypothetical protein